MEDRTCLYTFFNTMSLLNLRKLRILPLKEEKFFLYFSLFYLKKELFNSIFKSIFRMDVEDTAQKIPVKLQIFTHAKQKFFYHLNKYCDMPTYKEVKFYFKRVI